MYVYGEGELHSYLQAEITQKRKDGLRFLEIRGEEERVGRRRQGGGEVTKSKT
jgi:hypothetical protein